MTKYESSQKPNTYKRIEPVQNKKTLYERERSLLNEDNCDIRQSSSYPITLRKSSEDSNELFKYNGVASPQAYRSSSTPKLMEIQLNDTINNTQVSPISPLYRNQPNFCTPKNNRHSVVNKSVEKGTQLCLGDFIVNRKSSVKKKANKNVSAGEYSDESSKRIKPTNLTQLKSNGSFRKSDNSFNNFQSTKEVPVESLNGSRNFLAEERLKILSRKDSVGNLTAITSKTISSLMYFKVEIEPDINSVINMEELGYIVEIYVSILKNGLALNITSEIYFLISLLLVKHYDKSTKNVSTSSNEDMPEGIDFLNEEDRHELQSIIQHGKHLNASNLFGTIHNIVYFAARCLETQIDILKYYDKSTLNLLCKNKRLQSYFSSFSEKLGKISQKKSERVLELPNGNVETNVCFNLDTDNRDNFPNDSVFHAFRKQRDLFYDILRVWEKQHLVTGWDFSVGLGGKIKGLFSLQNDPVTFVHFSRLFKAQLLSTCGRFEKVIANFPYTGS